MNARQRGILWWLDKAWDVAMLAVIGAFGAYAFEFYFAIPRWNALGLGAVPMIGYWWLHVAVPVLTIPKESKSDG